MIESTVERRRQRAKRSGERPRLSALTGAAAFFAVSAIALVATVALMPTPWPP
jgi:hypothetical protein